MIQKYRTSILFVVGIGILIAGVVISLLRNTAILPSTIVLGTSLCGVGVIQKSVDGNGSK